MPSYQYRDSHYKNKMVSRPSYFYNGNAYTGKMVFYIETAPWCTTKSTWVSRLFAAILIDMQVDMIIET